MRRWERKLNSWLQAGLITSDQRDLILAHEEARGPKNMAAYTVIGLGALIITIGIISLVAYNWEKVPAAVKLTADFLLLAGLAAAAYRTYYSSKMIYFEIIGAVYFMLVAASIGLISQIFHTGGELYQAAAFWAVITIPLMALSRGSIIINLWMTALIIALQGIIFHAFKGSWHRDVLFSITMLFVLLPVIIGAATLIVQRFRGETLAAMSRSLAVWALGGALCGTIYLSVPVRYDGDLPLGAIVALILITDGLVIAGVILGLLKHLGKAALFLAVAIMLYGIMAITNLSIHGWEARQIPDALLFIFIWFAVAFLFYSLEYRRLFNLMIVGIGIRFLVIYFQIFKDLAVTGFGLIASGLVIIGACLLYIKKRESLYRLMDAIK